MKKLLMVCAFALAGVSAANAGVAVGALWGSSWAYRGWGMGNDIGLSVGLGSIGEEGNWDFGLRFWGNNGYFTIGLHADYILKQHNFVDWFGIYVGGGAYLGMGIGSEYFRADLGGRLPLGLRFMVIDHLDIWFAFVPSIGIAFGSGGTGLGGGLGGEFGIRWWF